MREQRPFGLRQRMLRFTLAPNLQQGLGRIGQEVDDFEPVFSRRLEQLLRNLRRRHGLARFRGELPGTLEPRTQALADAHGQRLLLRFVCHVVPQTGDGCNV